MHHRLLLGSTALVGAGLLFAASSPAQAQNGIEVRLGGFTEFGGTAATDDTLQSGGDRGYDFFMDNEVIINAEGTSDRGVTYGTKFEIEVSSGDSGGDVVADEVVIFFSGAFGRIEVGREDGAEGVMFVGGEDAQAGTGGINGDTANLLPLQIQDTSDDAKVTYFTPRVGGFQAGASYVPDEGDDGGLDAGTDFEQSVGVGLNWSGSFSGVDLILAAVGIFADNESDALDDKADWSIGGRLQAAGIEFGAGFVQRTDAAEADMVTVGLGYGFGPVNTSVGWSYHDPDATLAGGVDDQNVIAVSADVGILPGVVLKGDVSWNSDDTGAKEPGDDTWAGVLTVQLNY